LSIEAIWSGTKLLHCRRFFVTLTTVRRQFELNMQQYPAIVKQKRDYITPRYRVRGLYDVIETLSCHLFIHFAWQCRRR